MKQSADEKNESINQEYLKVLGEIEYEWRRNVHHNVSLLHIDFTKLDNNNAWYAFIEEQRKIGVDTLQIALKKKFKEDIKLEFYGRSDATLYPVEWGTEFLWTGLHFNPEGAGLEELEGAARLRRAKKVLRVLEYLNARLDKMIRKLPKEWDYFIKINELKPKKS